MRFGVRLALFLTVTLVVVQGITLTVSGQMMRRTLIADGQVQLAAAETRFIHQLSALEEQLASGVRLLTMDFALRQAIADGDAATVISALRNHGRRVGASQMMLLEPDGRIAGRSLSTGRENAPSFPYASMLESAAIEDSAASIVLMNQQPVWMVVVPVMAPDLIAFIAAAIPLDEQRLDRMRQLAGVIGRVDIVSASGQEWQSHTGTLDPRVLRDLPPQGQPRTIQLSDGAEIIVVTRRLATPSGAPEVLAVTEFPLTEVMHRYEGITLALLPVFAIGLVAMLLGAGVIARGVSRPLEHLARQTIRIAHGDYTPPPRLIRGDELGQLSDALHGMTRAIAEREDSIRFQATHDLITGLPNRGAIASTIDAAAAPVGMAVLAVSLSRWRDIADAVGRDVGDRLLREAATRIQACVDPAGRRGAVGRIGENTFVVLRDTADEAAAESLCHRLVAAFDQPYREQDFSIDTPVTVGVAYAPRDGTSSASLLRRSEIAATDAGTADRRYTAYRADHDPHRPERLSLMSELRLGLDRGEFQLVYQPKLDLTSNRISGAEALVRWCHPVHGNIPPDDFISLAEQTGNVQYLTRWVLRTGCQALAVWREQGLAARLAINVSARDLTDALLPGKIDDVLREFQLSPGSLILEITESAIMRDPDTALTVLRQLDL